MALPTMTTAEPWAAPMRRVEDYVAVQMANVGSTVNALAARIGQLDSRLQRLEQTSRSATQDCAEIEAGGDSGPA